MSSKPGKLQRILGLVIILVLSVIVAACGASATPAAPQAAPPTDTPVPTEAAPEPTPTEEVAPEPTPTEAAAPEAAEPMVEEAAPKGDPIRGAYVFATTGGCGCHMGQAGFLAGGNKFEGPFGVVYAPNITADPKTGIGAWTEQQIVDALRLGKRPDGKQLFPAMPYAIYSGMADQDAYDLAAYLLTVTPVENAVPGRELTAEPAPFTPAAPPPAVAPSDPIERGRYLVASVSRCADCHSPRAADGSFDMTRYLGGRVVGPSAIPNLTPDNETGLGQWSEEDIITLLRTGRRPDGSQVRGGMANAIRGGFKDLNDEDARAIAAFLKSLPPVPFNP